VRIVYLHGFASGPGSSKAQYFRRHFPQLEVPDLTEGDFEHSTISQQLRFLERTVDHAALIGSSMGGYLAALFAARFPERVSRLALLAPAFGLARLLAAVKDEYVPAELAADCQQYEDFPGVRQPTLIVHGRRDESVDYRLSDEFARTRPNVELVLLDSGHALLDMLPLIFARLIQFLPQEV
jgi:hypothetical protein